LNNRPSARLQGFAPIEVFLKLPRSSPLPSYIVNDRVVSLPSDIEENMDVILETIRKNRQKDQKRSGEVVNQFSVGDLVLYWNHRRSKIAVRWKGPFKILEKRGNHTFVLQDPLSGDQMDAHSSHMLLYDLNRELRKEEKDQLSFGKMGEYFEVEEIKDIAFNQDDQQYKFLVAWKGYSSTEDTWEGMPGLLEDIPVMLYKYLKKLKRIPICRKALKVFLKMRELKKVKKAAGT
jgi:hypothetical protein